MSQRDTRGSEGNRRKAVPARDLEKAADKPGTGKRARQPGRVAGATPFARGFSLSAWREQHLYGMFSSLGYLWRRRRATALTVAVMALALLLPLLLQVMLRNLEGFGTGLRDAREVSAFLTPRRDAAQVEVARAAAQAMAEVESVRVRTPSDALVELRSLEGFDGAAALLVDNPLPHVLMVTPRQDVADAGVRELARRLENAPHVDFVQYELAWRDRLNQVLALAERLAFIAGTVFALAALLVVGNTIRLDVAARASEITVVQLLGGTDAFVRRPFLYSGVWYGVAAALLALASALVVVSLVRDPALALAANYSRDFSLRGVSLSLAAATLAAGAMLGWLGAWVACASWLARGRPQ